ncbi:tripartite tricarboxylate transporter substrate binding protein [Cupriavidus metallidurans]|uniref:Bug family tripartite tricarboxylate transporter substrate binding protein n=1 Tax=Cupriavidus TaxID=106589 RepID=UPI000E925CC6|nr:MULTISPECIES: tripartite tricarboxylate transporter substrate binding protein [unclassified Cupriavidus]GMG93136.1 ABC transporter substrate-binding protein [Cupriavidus sp. TKC]HBD35259.1 tripartite tricarboxylate transporter substrate binding protein [Cupriavidus sp.]HBO76914.1 tripartite tricarboxylate transporter substrate binding protein [Cupriavidus sp.]
MNPSQLTRRRLLGAMALAGLVPSAFGNAYPSKAVRFVSPYGPGGSNDTSARILAEVLSRKYGQQVVVENKPGAGTRVASESVAHAAADGYTLLWAAAPFAINTGAGLSQRFDIHKDFVAVGPRVLGPVFLIVNANSPVKTVADFVKVAKQKPDGVNFASPGIGSGPHLTAELFASQAGFKVVNVHYRGDATAYTELLAGRVDATLTAITTALPFIQAGKLRVIAVAAEQRTPVYQDAPTFAEQGVPGVVGYGWFGIVAPAGTPAPIVRQLNQDASQALSDAQVRQKLLALGLQPEPGSSADFAAFIDSEVKKWGTLVRTRGLVLE